MLHILPNFSLVSRCHVTEKCVTLLQKYPPLNPSHSGDQTDAAHPGSVQQQVRVDNKHQHDVSKSVPLSDPRDEQRVESL